MRVLRAVTPGSLRSWGRRNTNGEQGHSRNRVFQLVRSGYEEVSKFKGRK